MNKKIIKFDVDEAEIIENDEDENSQFSTARILAFSSGKNLHSMICEEEDLKRESATLNGVPILYNFNGIFKSGDFGTHTDVDKNLIAGFVAENTQTFSILEDGTGRMGVTVIAKIWKKYAPRVIDIFKRKNSKSVSVEMELLDSEELPNGLIRMKSFIFQAVTLLGDLVTPASPGAFMEILSFSSESEECKKLYTKEFSSKSKQIVHKSRYAEIDFSISDEIKQNAKQGLEIAKMGEQSAGAVYMAVGRHLVSFEKVSSEKVRFINKKINSKLDFDEGTNEYLSFMLMGGSPSIEWSKSIVEAMDEKDSKMISYFGKSENNNEMEVKEFMDKTKEEEVKEEIKQEDMAVEEKVEKTEDMAVDTKAEEKEEDPKEEEKETPADEKAETPEEEKAEKKAGVEKKMSLDAYMDVSAVMGFLTKQTDDNKVIADKYASGELDDKELVCAMFAAMCKMSEQIEKFSEENMSLKEFKANVEKEQFAYTVESFMQEVQNALPAEEFAKAKEDSANFSLENLGEWKNKVKANAFNFSQGKKDKKNDFVAIAMPFLINQNSTQSDSKSPWKR